MRTVRYPPGPRSKYPGAHLLAFRRNPLAFVSIIVREYGDIAHGRPSDELRMRLGRRVPSRHNAVAARHPIASSAVSTVSLL